MYGNSRSLMLEYNSHGDVWIQFKRFIGTHKLTGWDLDHTDERSSDLQQENKIRTEVKGLSGVYLDQKSLQNPAFRRSLFSVVEPVLEPRLTSDSSPGLIPAPRSARSSPWALWWRYWQSDPRQSPHIPRGTPAESGETERERMVTGRAARGASAVMVLYHGADLEI